MSSATSEVANAGPGAILTINGGSSSVKFAIFEGSSSAVRGVVERGGSSAGEMSISESGGAGVERRTLEGADGRAGMDALFAWLTRRVGSRMLAGIGHRVVFGGPKLVEHQVVTPEVLEELSRLRSMDPTHLGREIELIARCAAAFPGVTQAACFDSVFHRGMPEVAHRVAIPREYADAGVRRYGFHGLSYEFLMGELERVAGAEAAGGRVVLAHLGSGASMAGVRGGRPIETTMGFTPASGLVMGTRSGDLDPGVLVHLMRRESMGADAIDDLVNHRSGLLGVSGTSADMRDLLARRSTDSRAAEAVELFCWSARKWIGALAAALGGLETLVFAGGIGENAPAVREEVCAELEFLGVRLDAEKNTAGDGVISADSSGVAVRVIKTDEESMLARHTRRIVGLKSL